MFCHFNTRLRKVDNVKTLDAYLRVRLWNTSFRSSAWAGFLFPVSNIRMPIILDSVCVCVGGVLSMHARGLQT